MQIYSFDDYRLFLRSKISSMPRKGRGQIEKISAHLGVHQSFVSQVLSGSKNMNEEQAYSTAQYLGLTQSEIEYFIVLVQRERITNPGLRQILSERLAFLSTQANPNKQQENLEVTALSEADRSVFYSSWYYSAIRLLSANPKFGNAEKIADQLGLPLSQVKVAIDFLLRVGFCVREGSRLTIGRKRTLISGDTPALGRHHLNWRLRAVDAIQKNPHLPLAYTSPMIISSKDANRIKEILQSAIRQIEPIVEPSPAEQLFCLNIDWFEF